MSDPSLPWLAAGFAVAWLVIGAYVVRLALVQRRIAKRLEALGEGENRGAGLG